jgi:parallel beta-helix repeat protein
MRRPPTRARHRTAVSACALALLVAAGCDTLQPPPPIVRGDARADAIADASADASAPDADASAPDADASAPDADASTPDADASTPDADADAPDTGVETGAVVNVRTFGAVGDGVTDDTTALNAAVRSLDGGPGTVVVPAGVYAVDAVGLDAGLRLASNMVLDLEADATLKVIPNASGVYQLVRVEDAHDVTIRGGTLLGDRNAHLSAGGEAGHGLVLRGSHHVVVEGVTATDFWGDGFHLGHSFLFGDGSEAVDGGPDGSNAAIRFSGCVANNNRRQGMSIVQAADVLVENCTFKNTHGTPPEAGIDLEPSFSYRTVRDVRIVGSTFADNGYGVLVVGELGPTYGNTIESNTIATSRIAGVALLHGTTNVVRANTISSGLVGISVVAATASTIEGNTVSLSRQQGLDLERGTDNVVSRNVFESDSQQGDGTFDSIVLLGGASRNSLTGNTCRRGTLAARPRTGARVSAADCADNSIIGNDFTGWTATEAIVDLGGGTVLRDNRF